MVHVGFDDPPRLAAAPKTEEERLAPYRRVRDEIRAFVRNVACESRWNNTSKRSRTDVMSKTAAANSDCRFSIVS